MTSMTCAAFTSYVVDDDTRTHTNLVHAAFDCVEQWRSAVTVGSVDVSSVVEEHLYGARLTLLHGGV